MEVAHKNNGDIKSKKNDAEAAALYEILKKLPKPDVKYRLNSNQKYWYNYFGQELVLTNKLTKVDLVHLVTLSVAMSIYSESVKTMNEKGYDGGVVQTFKSKAQQISPHIVVQNKQLPIIKEISAHFGFGFKDRSKLKNVGPTDKGQLSLFDKTMKELHG